MQAIGYGGSTTALLVAALSWVNAQVVTAGDLTPIRADIESIKQEQTDRYNTLDVKLNAIEYRASLHRRKSNLDLAIQKYESDLFTLENIKTPDRRDDYAGRLSKVTRGLNEASEKQYDVEMEMRAAGIAVE